MDIGNVISILAVVISFIGVLSSFIFSYKKADRERDREREINIQNITMIKESVLNINENLRMVKDKVDRIDETVHQINVKLSEHEQKIKHLEKEVFKNRRSGN